MGCEEQTFGHPDLPPRWLRHLLGRKLIFLEGVVTFSSHPAVLALCSSHVTSCCTLGDPYGAHCCSSSPIAPFSPPKPGPGLAQLPGAGRLPCGDDCSGGGPGRGGSQLVRSPGEGAAGTSDKLLAQMVPGIGVQLLADCLSLRWGGALGTQMGLSLSLYQFNQEPP